MLVFTYKETAGNVIATYSGRFAFLHFPSSRIFEHLSYTLSVDQLMNHAEISGLSTLNLAGVILHERAHKQIFSSSRCGLILNGWRFFARAHFLLTGNKSGLIKYYRARTAYFHSSYSCHENIVAALDKKESASPVTPKSLKNRFQSDINSAENSTLFHWKKLGVTPKKPRFFLKFGQWLQGSFAIMCSYRDKEGQFIYTGLAEEGITNDLGTIRSDNSFIQTMMKKLIHFLIVMPLFKFENFWTDFLWFWHSQRTQYQTLKEISHITYDDYLDLFVFPVCEFVLTWAGTPKQHHGQILELTEDTLVMSWADFSTKWLQYLEQNAEYTRFRRFFTFFYLHGN